MHAMARSLAAFAVACALTGLAGCGTMASGLMSDRDLYLFESHAADVDFGMSKARVQQIMGVPRNRLYEGNQEAWLWCQTSTSPKVADAYLTVYFHQARVAGIHTYGNRAEGTCENFLRRVEWLPDPEKSMAAKVRRRG
jgi:outer membrane protein assembly factor BamE (lipoprotein component of BamABCDE complex)